MNAPVGTIACATFSISDDSLVESTEFFTVQATGGLFMDGEDTTQVNIVDNDGMYKAFHFSLHVK